MSNIKKKKNVSNKIEINNSINIGNSNVIKKSKIIGNYNSSSKINDDGVDSKGFLNGKVIITCIVFPIIVGIILKLKFWDTMAIWIEGLLNG